MLYYTESSGLRRIRFFGLTASEQHCNDGRNGFFSSLRALGEREAIQITPAAAELTTLSWIASSAYGLLAMTAGGWGPQNDASVFLYVLECQITLLRHVPDQVPNLYGEFSKVCRCHPERSEGSDALYCTESSGLRRIRFVGLTASE